MPRGNVTHERAIKNEAGGGSGEKYARRYRL